MKRKIFCTLGPSTLNKDFLKFAKNKIDLLRLNMSHLNLSGLEKAIKLIKKSTNIPICIDTEGAQIRSKVQVTKKIKKNDKFYINRLSGNFRIYPDYVFSKLKKNDKISIGFDNLKGQIIKVER